MNSSLRNALLLALLASALAVFFVDLGGSSIWDANEAFYVETPREMLERGDYVFPTFNYEPRVNKPVLSYWIVAGFYRAFGVSVGVERVPIAIGGVLLVGIAFMLGRLAAPAAGGLPLVAGLWAALGFAVSPRLVMFSRRIFIDIYITLFMAATLLCFALAERYPHRRRLFLSLMYASVGLGVLTKGPVAALLPGLVFFIYLVAHRELRRVTEMMIPAGLAIVMAIVVPWYAALYQRDGWTHITSFFLGENVGRYSDGVGYDMGRGLDFYPGVLLGDGFPWSLLLVSAFILWRRHRADAAALRVQSLLLVWTVVIVAFFSFSASKQDLYIYPVMPAVAALGGVVIAAAGPGARLVSALIGLLLAMAGAGVAYIFQASGNVYAMDGVVAIAALGIAGGLSALTLAISGRWHKGLLVFLAASVAINWVLVLRVLPSFEKYKPVPSIAQFLEPRLGPGDVVAHYSVALPSMVYYLRRHIDITYDRQTFIDIMRQPRRVFAVLWTKDYESLRGELAVPTCVLHHTPSFNVKIGAVLRREPLPELVLITNDCR